MEVKRGKLIDGKEFTAFKRNDRRFVLKSWLCRKRDPSQHDLLSLELLLLQRRMLLLLLRLLLHDGGWFAKEELEGFEFFDQGAVLRFENGDARFQQHLIPTLLLAALPGNGKKSNLWNGYQTIGAKRGSRRM